MKRKNSGLHAALLILAVAIVMLNSVVFSSSLPLVKWNKTYGGDGADVANFAQQTVDGGYIVAGYTGSYDAGSVDFWLVKTSFSGGDEWNKTYGGISRDEAYAVRQTIDGGYIVVGYTSSFGAGFEDVWLVKTDSLGNVVWNKTYGGIYDDMGFSVLQTIDGGYIVVGYTSSFGAGFEDVWLVKTDSLGNVVWNKTYGGEDSDYAYSIQQASDGGYIVAGSRYFFVSDQFDVWLVKTDSTGNMQWNQTFGLAGDDEAYSVQQTSDGGYIVVASTNSFSSSRDIWVIKTDSSGVVEWNEVYGGLEREEAGSVQQISDGGYIVAGTKYVASWNPDIWLIRIAGLHDISVIDVEPSKTIVGEGSSIDIMVTIKNWGQTTETFNVTAKVNTSIIETREIALNSGNSTTIKFAWNTLGYAKGNYEITVTAAPVAGETETNDNTYINGEVFVTLPGDTNGDKKVDILDAIVLAAAFGSTPGDSNWNPNADIRNDEEINILDALVLSAHFGEEWT